MAIKSKNLTVQKNILTEHEMSYANNSVLFCEVDMHANILTNQMATFIDFQLFKVKDKNVNWNICTSICQNIGLYEPGLIIATCTL